MMKKKEPSLMTVPNDIVEFLSGEKGKNVSSADAFKLDKLSSHNVQRQER